jgi:hypothetical protein
MKNVLLLILTMFTISGFSQNWCHSGSIWHENEYSQIADGYVTYTYAGDTIVSNRSCQKLSSKLYEWVYNAFYDTISFPNLYTYSANDTVYFYYPSINKWYPTYYFNAQPGDSINMVNLDTSFTPDSIAHGYVDDIGTVNINGISLRYYDFHLMDTCEGGPGFITHVIERIGAINNGLQPSWLCGVDYTSYSFRCFQDDSFAVYPNNVNCDYLPTGINQVNATRFSIVPNPADNELRVMTEESAIGKTAIIYDITGNKIASFKIENPNATLDVSHYAPGLYLLTITGGTGNWAVQKFGVQH